MTENPELLPCRWCDWLAEDSGTYQMDQGPWQVVCGSCLACGPASSTEQGCITNWNTRPEPQASLEELKTQAWDWGNSKWIDVSEWPSCIDYLHSKGLLRVKE